MSPRSARRLGPIGLAILWILACSGPTPPAPGPPPAPTAGPSVAATPRPAASTPASAVGTPLAQVRPSPPATLMAAPSPAAPGLYGFGRPAAAETIRALDVAIRPDGKGLPPGSGTAVQGRAVYAARCLACHGAEGAGTPIGPQLVGTEPFQPGHTPTIGNYWPYATTVWDYVRRAMPFNEPGSLTADEVYAVTAYLLFANQLLGENDVLNAERLPTVRMPHADAFTSPDPRPDVP